LKNLIALLSIEYSSYNMILRNIYTVLFSVIVMMSQTGCNKHQRKKSIPFNQQTWLAGDREVKGQMVDHIIDDSLLFGKTKEQVVEMLGGDGDTTLNLSYPVDLGYRLGPYGMGGVWLFELDVRFDSLTRQVNYVRCHD
jgi:hypothetical protein